jgi:hypothetical protein
MVLGAFAGYDLDCGERLLMTRNCEFVTYAGDDAVLSIEASSSSEIHIVWLSVSHPLGVDVPETLRALELIARLPYTGSQPQAAADWLHANYADTGFTPEEADFGPGHFVLRVTEPMIGDLELRAPDY